MSEEPKSQPNQKPPEDTKVKDSGHCQRCGCPEFVVQGGLATCGRPTCHHGIADHIEN
jgi:hypothetical protein